MANDKVDVALDNLVKLGDICSQINNYQTKLLTYIYDQYLRGKVKDSMEQYSKKIIKKHRVLFKVVSDDEAEEDVAKRCKFVIWEKGKTRRCKFPIFEGHKTCKRHIDKYSILNPKEESSDSEESSNFEESSDSDESSDSSESSEEEDSEDESEKSTE